MDKYTMSYTQSYYGKRKGITLVVNAINQDATEIFKQNNMYGGDALFNYGPLDFVFEYDFLYRNSYVEKSTVSTTDKVYSAKAGYNYITSNSRIIQLTIAYSNQLANQYGKLSYTNELTGATNRNAWDVGFNYLLNKDKLKLSLHYLWGNKKNKSLHLTFSYLGSGFQYLF